MFAVITGGSGSGKSEYAENLLLSLDQKTAADRAGGRFYIATMFPFDEESHKRIERHRNMRAGKGFETLECYVGLKNQTFPAAEKKPSVLLECMSNLTANEFYREDGAGSDTVSEIIAGIRHLIRVCEHVVVVTNEVFSDGIQYDPSTMDYIRVLAQINREMSRLADQVTEVVYSIPVTMKGEKTC